MEYLRSLLALANQYPEATGATLGIIFSIAATQYFKFLIPDTYSEVKYRAAVRSIGVVTGWVFGYLAWKVFDPHAPKVEDLFYSLGIGFASPLVYSIGIALLLKWKPELNKAISGRPDKDGSP